MCEFLSWLTVEKDGQKHILYLDDQELFSERTREILKGSKDNDFLGHHGLRLVYNLKEGEGKEGECRDFWETNRLPKEIQPKLRNFQALKQNFGKMLETCAQPDDLQYIIQNAPKDEKWKGLKEFCEQTLKASLLRNVQMESLKITTRYDLSIDELVKFKGYVNPDVNDRNFKEEKRPKEKKEAVLVCLNRYARTEEVEAVIKSLRLRPGTVKELLSFAIDHPNLKKKFPIVELGSSWRDPVGDRHVAYLSRWVGERFLRLYWFGYGCGGDYRFLAFRES